MNKLLILALILFTACADLTSSGRKVKFIESDGKAYVIQEKADVLVAKHDCQFIGYIDAKTSLFPGSYSVHENEIHTALRNRAAKMGANLVIANFYVKPAQGVGLLCPEEFLNQH